MASKRMQKRLALGTSPADIDRGAEGGLSPSKPPYGLRVNDVGEWEQVPEEIEHIRRMATWRLRNGASYPAIARRLNAEGVPSPGGGAKGWSPTTVWRILRYPAYWHRPDPTLARDSFEAIRMAQAAKASGFLGDEFPSHPKPVR